MSDRYMEVVEQIFDGLMEKPFDRDDPDNHELRTYLHQLIRTAGRDAVLRSHCDSHGHQPEVFFKVRNVRNGVVIHKMGCSHCGIELKAVDE